MGQADLKSDGSNRAAAQKTALEAALADIEAQAEVIASATGLSISGVLSVSASVSNYGPVPYALAVPGAAPTSGVPAAVQPDPSVSQLLSVAITVAYSVGGQRHPSAVDKPLPIARLRVHTRHVGAEARGRGVQSARRPHGGSRCTYVER